VRSDEREAFVSMARSYFCELNPAFVPTPEWPTEYFAGIEARPDTSLCWIVSSEVRVGFALFGREKHRFLPKTIGFVYEIYIQPSFRRQGVAREVALQIIQRLSASGVAGVQLEIAAGNQAAARFWEQLGFSQVAQRYTRSAKAE
jgi:ribosomal protein S18 acetylase RimI-like enzyme